MRQFLIPRIEKIEPSQERVFLSQGIARGVKPSKKIVELYSKALLLYRELAEPKGVIETISIKDFSQVYSGMGMNEKKTPLGIIYPQSQHLAILAFTLGETISQEITRLFNNNDFALGSMLDSVASEGADMATRIGEQEFYQFLMDKNQCESSTTVLIYSPGYCGWHLSAQKRLFEYLGPEQIGITLNQQFLMVPLKSITGVLVAGKRDIHIFKNNFSFCRLCSHKSCLQRIKPLIQEDKEIKHGNIKSNLTASADGR